MTKREIIGNNPLDVLIGDQQVKVETPKKESSTNSKKRITVQISEDMIERIKNATYWTPGLTLSHLVEKALDREVSHMENERGQCFEQRKEEIKRGRPLN